MSVWVPDFYDDFRCKAGACTHNCCRGWEIDVDRESAEFYRQLPGPLGDALRRSLEQNEEGWHFRLTEDQRCPFLQEDGLCRLIRELGEESLCDICALHPRFFQELDTDELWGLGLSCEAVAELLLHRDRLLFLCRETGQRQDLNGLLRMLGLTLPPEALQYRVRINEDRRRELLDRFQKTEPIDSHWPVELAGLEGSPLPEETGSAVYQMIYDYVFYRQIELLADWGWEKVAAYARLSANLIALWDAKEPDTVSHLRRWSEQIEYSTENVEILLK